MKQTLLLILPLLFFSSVFCQDPDPDSLKTLDEVTIRAFEQNRVQDAAVTSVKVMDARNGDRYNKMSIVNGFNTIAGARMEERSPGSYRINIRGSSLRSPFGVRNVKVYWNDIPVTDPGGNTYFNQFAWNNFSHLEVFKGPAGSLYGAGTGGLILMNTLYPWQPGLSLEYITGSYNLQNVLASVRYGRQENMNQVSFAHNETNGYRDHSRMRRDNFSWITKLKISDKQQFAASLLFTDMYYQTPGALTFTEFTNNPKAARPAAGAFPSATAAKAAIEQLNFLAGFTHSYKITSDFSNQTTFYGTFTEIKNPAIRNYEKRGEPGFGGRTVFNYTWKEDDRTWQFVCGSEFQHGFFNTLVFQNLGGSPDTLQTNDDIVYTATSVFAQGDIGFGDNWFVNAGFSLNRTKVGFTRLNISPVMTQSRIYRNEVAPRITIKKILEDGTFFRATISRGFSPPTVAELLPSTGMISTNLEPEYGWNYEFTAGRGFLENTLRVELTGFYFRLNNALVQRRDSAGADFFVNAGEVKQRGAELTADYTRTARNGFLHYYRVNAAYTFNAFRYGQYIRGLNDDYSGNKVPSVPAHTLSLLLDIQFAKGFYSYTTFYSASRIWLNDANTAVADDYQVLGWRIGWKKTFNRKHRLNIYAGADNLLDQVYSLGHDINAAGGRYYNAAPRRNFYAGISLQWLKPAER